MAREPAKSASGDPEEVGTTSQEWASPENRIAEIFAELLAEVVQTESVPLDSHFFDDLGADSLVMAHFCARVRKRPDLPAASMKDIYKCPTVRSLAAALADAAPAPASSPTPAPQPAPEPVSTVRYALCGAAQLLFFLGYAFLLTVVTVRGYEWISEASNPTGGYGRAVVFGAANFLGMSLLPIAAKWLLIGRWTARDFPLWGPTYLRFWVVKVLVQSSPLTLFVGNPVYVFYLRALGARVGKHVTILSRSVPVCADLLTIGAGTVIRKEAFFLCHRAHAGRIETGPVTIGRDAFVGERSVLDIRTSMGDGAQLGHTSALHSGMAVPSGQHWHGSPAQRTEVDYLRVEPARCGTLRRAAFGIGGVLKTLLVVVPLTMATVEALLTRVRTLAGARDAGAESVTSSAFYVEGLALSLVLFAGFLVLGPVLLFTVPRLLSLAVKPDVVYPLYGVRYSLHRTVQRMTNARFFLWLFGDSSYIVHYLRCLGYDLSQVEQTGSNFGIRVQHESPYLSTVGSGTMVADGLSIINTDISSTSFRLSRTSIGSSSFLGNHISYPSGGRTGDNCLLATKVMVPLDGEVRQGTGLLGSPSFEIPRTVERDTRFDHLRDGEGLRRGLAAKDRYNIRTMGVVLFLRWLHVLVVTLLGLATIGRYDTVGQLMEVLLLASVFVFTALYYALVERCMTRFRPLRPMVCSIYDPYFWHHERLWKVPHAHLQALNGTPFKSVFWRLLGVRVGRRVYDDGCDLSERTLVAIGDDCALNAASAIQCHSQEDGTFKSDRSTLGAGCTIGVGALVHYGVTMGDGATLAADSFLMKGEDVPAYARWGGNPAGELRGPAPRPVVAAGAAALAPAADRRTPPPRPGADGAAVAKSASG
ncbi:Pls/PosA family non-ribosomal peptide synthetase [Streptomyces buecherae]|uniref:Peptide synthetase n=1 Tax=Streptomyces buecherae TaxID=2763006 RepID=A0A7H8N3K1_9ACTN|nr:peptide synthetase [Streptomyces buecherae]